MNDLHSALAVERTNTFLAQAGRERLVRLAACCTPGGVARGIAHVRAAGSATLRWLRKGQLGGMPQPCPC